jgi:two-component system, sensor histidine kinase RegB
VNAAALRGPLVELDTTLASLRWCAVAALVLTLLFAHYALRMELAYGPVWAGAGALVLANAAARWRSAGQPASEARLFGGLLFDMIVLAWMLYWTGGAANPFISLFLLPVALTASVLAPRRVVALAVLGALAYGVLMAHARPMPRVPGTDPVSLHLMGMWVNFLLSLVLLTGVTLRLSARLVAEQRALSALRARQQREQTLLGLAVQAAGTAHEVNTPLATMATIVDELRRLRPDDATLDGDLAVLAQQLEHCRRSMQALSASARGEPPAKLPVDAWLRQLVSRWRIVRPRARVDFAADASLSAITFTPDPTLSQTVLNLLDNALDASLQADREDIVLVARSRGGDLELRVRDFGAGLAGVPSPGHSGKPSGLGLGLLLSTASLDAIGGRLDLWPAAGGGTEAVLYLPDLVRAGREPTP